MNNNYNNTSNKLKIMGHPTRLQILDMLRDGEVCVCHIEYVLNKRQAYVSQQLKVLREAGLVDTYKEGLMVFYQLADDEVIELLDLLFGTTESDGHDILEGCNCPACSVVIIE